MILTQLDQCPLSCVIIPREGRMVRLKPKPVGCSRTRDGGFHSVGAKQESHGKGQASPRETTAPLHHGTAPSLGECVHPESMARSK